MRAGKLAAVLAHVVARTAKSSSQNHQVVKAAGDWLESQLLMKLPGRKDA